MEKNRTPLGRRAFKGSALALILMAAVGTAIWTPRSIWSQQITPQVENRTQTLQVISIEPKGGDYLLSLKNGSDKSINGYSLAIGPRGILDADLTTVGRAIAPGASFTERIPAANLRSSSTGDSLQPTITIMAVLFEDSTSEGDSSAIDRHKARRAGAKGQLDTILPLIKATLDTPDSELPAALEKLKARVASLPEMPDHGRPPAFTSGLKGAKQDTLMMLQNLQAGPGIRAELIEIKEKLERRIGKL
ncbi:MAG TPA: hypothetical protein VF544_01795 [Pyrinomonadaceae bacterium]